MAIAHDAETLGAANTATGGNYDTTHTPAGVVAGVCVIVVNSTAVTDAVTAVTYGVAAGAVPLVRQRFVTEATEPGGVCVYWAGGVAFPTGAQTLRVAKLTGNANNIRAYIATMTCGSGSQVALDTDTTGTSASVSNPAWTMTTTDPVTQCYLGIHSGLQTMTTTPATNWTLGGSEDVGAIGRGWARRAMASAGDTGAGWTAATADDYVAASIAFRETSLPSAPVPYQLARSPRPVEQGQVAGPYAIPAPPSRIF